MENKNNLNEILQDFQSVDEAMEPTAFAEDTVHEENQLFLSPWQMVWRRFFQNKLAVAGVVVLAIMFLFSFLGPVFYPYGETELFYLDKATGEEIRQTETERLDNAVINSLARPSSSHPLGTTKMGIDMLARLMYGGRVSLLVGFCVVLVELLLGILVGGAAGYYRGKVDSVLMRLTEIIASIPLVPIMLIIAAMLVALGISPQVKIYYTMFILGAIYWPHVARLVRGDILTLRESDFMQAANAAGIRPSRQITKHLIPNAMPNLIVTATMDLGTVILLESTLSFLGVGVGAPYASWGNLVAAVNENAVMIGNPELWVTPGLCILFTVLAFNFVGDGLRDATDPKMKGR